MRAFAGAFKPMLSAWQLWIAAGIALCTAEIWLPNFFLMPLGFGAFAAAAPAAMHSPSWAQLAGFCAGSAAAFASSRTIFKRFLMRGAVQVRMNAEAMVGAEAVVVEPVADGGTGTVRIHGELWAARSLTGPLQAGEIAIIERMDGLKLYVRKPGQSLFHTRKEP